MPTEKYLLAHDTGTGGNKAVLTDLRGRVVCASYKPYAVSYPRPDWAEQDPEALWQAVADTTREVLAQAGAEPSRVIGVGISAQMFNLLAVDEHGQPLAPMLSWLDVRSARQADRLLEGDLPRLLYQWTGNVPTAKDVIPKILWLREERPDLWERTARLVDCKEYLLFRLTGRWVTDWHGASAYFLFDPHARTWSRAACEALGIPPDMLPPALPCTAVVGEVTEAAAHQTGLLPGTTVVACAGDVATAQCGAGASAPGRAHLCVGTATWVGVSSSVFVNDADKPFWGLSHIDPDKWIIAGEMETGGGALMWFRDTFLPSEAQATEATGRSSYDLLASLATSVAPGADRLLFLPWLSGERAPVLDHYARGAFIGLSLGHTRAHMARAVMEGVGLHIRWIIEAMQSIGLPVSHLNAIGGGSTSPVWSQIISNILGRRLHVVKHAQEAGAIGAALCVAVGLGLYPSMESVDELIEISHTVEPQMDDANVYDLLYREYRHLYEALSPVFRRLRAAQDDPQ
jgi:xylulokinase